MIVGPFDPLVLALLGTLIGLLHRFRLARGNADRYVVLSVVVIVGFWLHVLVANGTDLAVMPAVAVASEVVAVCYALAYPFWYWLGTRIVFLLVGRRPEQGGLLWIYVIEDYTESFEEQWE